MHNSAHDIVEAGRVHYLRYVKQLLVGIYGIDIYLDYLHYAFAVILKAISLTTSTIVNASLVRFSYWT